VSADDNRLSAEQIVTAVREAGHLVLPDGAAERFSLYFDLLQRWNAKLNLTSIRNPHEILERHFLECIFCAQKLPQEMATLLDYGSGSGFPGIPIALCRPEIRVTLAESQRKKASFLREAVRSLSSDAEVYGGRVEEMPAGRTFDAVALRAVDSMQEAIQTSVHRVKVGGWLVLLTSGDAVRVPDGFSTTGISIPGSLKRVLILARHNVLQGDVPRETLK
jgi:16S rRNA (guanine527-N7)-methyltransferase